MKTENKWGMCTMIVFLIGLLISICSCGDKCKCNGDCHGTQCSVPCADDCRCTYTMVKSIVGRWVAIEEENGDTFIMCFKEDGTGYGCDGYKEERVKDNPKYQFSYKIKDDEIHLYGYNSIWNGMQLDYTLSSDGKQLTIYGIDDNDLSVMHFTKK